MKHKFIISAFISILSLQASAQERQECENAIKPLYIDIQIYKRTEAVTPGEGLVGKSLQEQFEILNSNVPTSMHEVIQSSQVGLFRSCDVNLTDKESASIDIEVDHFNKRKNPLITE